jgi:hypothetical protein
MPTNYAKERDAFMAEWRANGGKLDDARTMLRYAATLRRLAEAQCNGDYPCDNGQRETKACSACSMGYAPETLARDGACRECRTARRAQKLAESCGFRVNTSGDPRGYVLRVMFPNYAYNTWSGADQGYGVPTRS